MSSLVTWVEATGLQPDDLARYEQHQRRIRIVVAERLREVLQARRDDVLLPILERLFGVIVAGVSLVSQGPDAGRLDMLQLLRLRQNILLFDRVYFFLGLLSGIW